MIESQSFILFTFKTVGQKSDKSRTKIIEFINGIRFRARKTYKKMFSERKRKGTSSQRIFGSAESVPSDTK